MIYNAVAVKAAIAFPVLERSSAAKALEDGQILQPVPEAFHWHLKKIFALAIDKG